MLKQYLSLIFGTFVFSLPVIAIVTLLYFLPFTRLDILYNASLFIPRTLGIVAEVEPDEIVELHSSQTHDVFLEEGRYRIYSSDSLASQAAITLISQETAETIQAISLPPNDTDPTNNEDEPQYIFRLNTTGSYSVATRTFGGDPLSDDTTYTIVPYVGNQNAAVAIIGGLIQLTIVAFCLRLVYLYMKKDQIQELKAAQARKRGQWETFLDEKNNQKDRS